MPNREGTMDGNIAMLVKVSAFSRICIFFLQLILNLAPDHAADAFNPPVEDTSQGVLDSLFRISMDGYFKWDAKYFVHVARYGYEEEKMFAFFPLFPALLRCFAALLHFLLPLSLHSSLLLSGAVLNTVFFVGATKAIYQLTYVICKKQNFALLSALAFCFNPASIFFSSNYTESLYCYCVFNGLYLLETANYTTSALFFLAGSATRSNGTVNAGFIAYYSAQRLVEMVLHRKKNDSGSVMASQAVRTLNILVTCLLTCCAIILPFALFNLYGYRKYCYQDNPTPTWCSQSIPVIYSHVQAHHWDVGFMNYFKLIKLPNFLLALPCQAMVTFGVYRYFMSNAKQIKTLGLLGKYGKSVCSASKLGHPTSPELVTQNIFVYVAHVLFLMVFALFFMHVEVTTRFLMSSSPFPHWVAASVLSADMDVCWDPSQILWRRMSRASKLVILYYGSYIIIGTMLHSNYLPWT